MTLAINNFYWIRYFALPERISEMPLEFRMCYNQFLFETIKRFNKAINDDDWQHVGELIGSIDIDSNARAGNNNWYTTRITLVKYNLLWENLFFIGFQRILLQNVPSKQKAVSLENMLKKFSELISTEMYRIRKLLPLFVISVLTFGIAHNNVESISQILRLKIPVKFNEPDLNFNIRAYQFYNQFKEMCEDSDTTPNNDILNDFFQTMLDFFDSATEKKMKKLLFLFEPFVMLSQYVEGETRALETLIRFCIETPALLPFTAKILTRCGLGKFVGRLISECIEHDPSCGLGKFVGRLISECIEHDLSSTFLHRFPLIIHYIGQRSIQAIQKRSLKYEDAEKHVRMSFNYLDYGRNRTNGDAWLFFKENLEYLIPFPDWVYQEWNERADWWPRFHNISLDNNEIERAQVFRMFRRQNKKRKL
uniref:Uncharacterized protein n=1 Tax=Panagrolaimus sp. ES5 TaxID=591445 RepID=A0AC34FI41_9BILA